MVSLRGRRGRWRGQTVGGKIGQDGTGQGGRRLRAEDGEHKNKKTRQGSVGW